MTFRKYIAYSSFGAERLKKEYNKEFPLYNSLQRLYNVYFKDKTEYINREKWHEKHERITYNAQKI